jgi:hypothetical protein
MSVISRGTSSRLDGARDALATARVRAKNINGVGVAAALHPTGGYREELARKGVVPTDHFKANIDAMRRKQREAAAAKVAAEEEAAAEKFKLKRFSGVTSRVAVSAKRGWGRAGGWSART